MEGRVREPAEGNAEAKPVGCPWQMLQFTTQKIRCGNAQANWLLFCRPTCEMYLHLQALNTQIQELKEKAAASNIRDITGKIESSRGVDCIACTQKEDDERGGQG